MGTPAVYVPVSVAWQFPEGLPTLNMAGVTPHTCSDGTLTVLPDIGIDHEAAWAPSVLSIAVTIADVAAEHCV